MFYLMLKEVGVGIGKCLDNECRVSVDGITLEKSFLGDLKPIHYVKTAKSYRVLNSFLAV